MGRKIRRVPARWEHPRDKNGNYLPMHDDDYDTAAQEWIDRLMTWERGENSDREECDCRYFWDWHGGPPDKEYYLPKFETEPTHYQIYENVTEGTPWSPVFETLNEMIQWLVNEGYSAKAAERFAESGYVPTYMTVGGTMYLNIHMLDQEELIKKLC